MFAWVIKRNRKSELWSIANKRNGSKEPEWTRRASDVFNDAELDMLGVFGEEAAANLLAGQPDFTTCRGGDDGTDLLLHDGTTAAVKYNHRYQGYLMVEQRDGDDFPRDLVDLTADKIILTHGWCDPPRRCVCRNMIHGPMKPVVIVAGWLQTEEFIERCQFADWGLGGRYYVTCSQLRPIDELLRI